MRLALVLVLTACGRIDFEPAERVVCPATYQPVADIGSTYRLLPDSLTWVAGEDACKADTAHLVVFRNAAEASAVLSLIPPAGGGANVSGDEVWVGISDLETEGVFLTVEGDPAMFLPWDVGEPNNESDEDCVEAHGNGAFNDLSCDAQLRVICECKPN